MENNKLGVIGLGHWFNRLNAGIDKVGGLSLTKAAGTKRFEEKADLLRGFGIPKDNYCIADRKGHLPDSFFDGIDVVHISDPNKFHAYQAMEALSHGKYTIVEKTYAINKREFNRVISFINKNNYGDKAYLHLHYIHKQPTQALKVTMPGLVKKHGKIKSVIATFFEKENTEDARRGWLFAPENGGIFMDWIHPFETLYYATDSTFGNVKELSAYAVNASYDNINPTGVRALVALSGKYYAKDATATINVAKGTGESHEVKSIKILFESGKYANLCFVGSQLEFGSEDRGTLEIGEQLENGRKTLMSSRLLGPNSSEIFVEEILGLCNGENIGLGLKGITKIFKPQWEYQKLVGQIELIRDAQEINAFLERGSAGMRCSGRNQA